jgi:ATP-dependent helicase HepA
MLASPRFQPFDLLLHRLNPDLGPGRVLQIDARRVTVAFRGSDAPLTLNAADDALVPVVLETGDAARLDPDNERVQIAARLEPTQPGSAPRYRLADGREVDAGRVWPDERPAGPVERLAGLVCDPAKQFVNRVEGLALERVRQARGLGSFLGGRIALFPHQLHVAERATISDPVRFLLADEVGLGKTIEACLILSRLLRTGRAERALIVAPDTLTVQWLGELWRKFHQTFVLLDARRRADVAVEFGASFNPFESHSRLIVPLEDLEQDPRLTRQVAAAGVDLLIVDEAHRLERRRGENGGPAYLAVRPLTEAARHVLLLTATPLEADTHGFFRLLELLRPAAYASEEDFLSALESGRPLPPCTSATRRVDMGGIPPRVPLPVDLATVPPQSGLSGRDAEDAADPRVMWLAREMRRWAPDGDDSGKALVFVHDRATLQALKTRLEAASGQRVSIFHEELPADRRDLEVADFRRPEGPTLLISTECGGEGRNFEFCRRLVLFDLPRDPAQVEQRIGRLDRVTRQRPIEIHYFRSPSGFEAELVRLYEEIGLFQRPLGGFERTLSRLEAEIRKRERLYAQGRAWSQEALVSELREALSASERAVHHHLHQDGYHLDRAAGILARVPADLDTRMQRFVTRACDLLGLDTIEKRGVRTWYLELGSSALVDSLPGVPGGSRYLGSFERSEAVLREELDFFASGHPLVEGLFQELHDGARGRVALVSLAGSRQREDGFIVLRRATEGPVVRAFDLSGRERPEWAELVLAGVADLRGIKADEWLRGLPADLRDADDWKERTLEVVRAACAGEAPEAVAGLRLLP